jgi:glycerate-2-kinase
VGAAPLPRTTLEGLLRAGLRAANAGAAVARHVSVSTDGSLRVGDASIAPGERLVVLAVGKAASPMARALVEVAPGRVARGLVVTKDGHGEPVPGLALRETAHPVPDARCEAAGREALRLAASGREHERLVVLLSGGASSLLACPAEGLSLSDVASTTDALLHSGADIEAMNTVRKHLSALAGGRLAEAWRGGPIVLLAVSDVPGDRLDVIGSGPCTPDPSTFEDAWQVLAAAGLTGGVPEAVRRHLLAGRRGQRPETPDRLEPVHACVIAANETALAAIAEAARREGLRVQRDPSPLAGEARAAALRLLADARAAAGEAALLWIAGGETTVQFESKANVGRGGRNQELALAAALAIEGDPRVTLLAAGTDGSDGPTDAAGAFVDGDSVARGSARGFDARSALARHDSHAFFVAEGGVLRTGPTGTNVMDLALVSLG